MKRCIFYLLQSFKFHINMKQILFHIFTLIFYIKKISWCEFIVDNFTEKIRKK